MFFFHFQKYVSDVSVNDVIIFAHHILLRLLSKHQRQTLETCNGIKDDSCCLLVVVFLKQIIGFLRNKRNKGLDVWPKKAYLKWDVVRVVFAQIFKRSQNRNWITKTLLRRDGIEDSRGFCESGAHLPWNTSKIHNLRQVTLQLFYRGKYTHFCN